MPSEPDQGDMAWHENEDTGSSTSTPPVTTASDAANVFLDTNSHETEDEDDDSDAEDEDADDDDDDGESDGDENSDNNSPTTSQIEHPPLLLLASHCQGMVLRTLVMLMRVG